MLRVSYFYGCNFVEVHYKGSPLLHIIYVFKTTSSEHHDILQGYNGSQLWDTAFTTQAIISTNLVEEYGPTLRKAHTYMKKSQVRCNCHFAIIIIL